MIRFLEIAVLSVVFFWLGGCNSAGEDKAVREGLKIGDLAPWRGDKRAGVRSLKTIGFNVYIFEMPAENVSALDDIWRRLYTGPLQFVDYEAFGANSFSAGFGQVQTWNAIAGFLEAAGGRRVRRVSVLVRDGEAGDVAIAGLPREETIFYVSRGDSLDGLRLGPGGLGLRIEAARVPGLRGVCNVSVWPVFTSAIRRSIPHLRGRVKPDEFLFVSAGFKLKMSPGDFFLLGPEKHVRDPMALGGYLFSKGAPSPGARLFVVAPSSDTEKRVPYFGPVVRAYLVVCTAIND